ncbi:MAG: ABC transporter ATP-binding protein [Chloroflexi bacterium]|nr:ABC transporter ATP-binding protein [Chloroflexota bacterium]
MALRFRKFLSYYKPYRHLLAADIACAVIVAAVTLILPLCARAVTQTVLNTDPSTALGEIAGLAVLMIGLVVVQTACNIFVDYQGHMMGTLMESDIRTDLFDHYQKLSFGFYDEHRTGPLMSRLTNDLFAISELAHHVPEESIIALLKFAGAFIILLTINAGLTLMLFLFLPLMAVYALYFNRRMNAALWRNAERMADVNAQVEDTLAGIRVVQSFANEEVERRKFAHENRRFVETRRADYQSEAYFYGGMIAFTQALTIGVILLGAVAIVNASLSAADLVTYLLFIAILIDPIMKFTNIARLFQEGITGYNRFMEIMEIEPDIKDGPDAVELGRVQGRVTFTDVSFKYRQNHGEILRDVSLTIRAGEFVALVGTSGVGKSTLCSLIPRFYDVTQGAVLIDAHDVRDVSLRSLRRNIGVVQQDVYLFAGTVRDNIRYGRSDATMDEIVMAAKQANAHDFIMALPDGYDSDVGQRGVKLSGGQKQRLSIARVFLKDPPIIIFDEATSALDNESERAVQEALGRLALERTTIVIAHRLSTVRNAERILVLTDAGISESGTHDELLALGGVYAGLYNVQLEL